MTQHGRSLVPLQFKSGVVGGETGKEDKSTPRSEVISFSSNISAGLSGRGTRSQSCQEGVLFAFAPPFQPTP